MLSTDINVQIDHFDGPLSLLLYLVQKEEMDIKELNLTRVTQQYLDYLRDMRDLNFDIAGEYLYLASTLIYLKSEKSLDEDEKVRFQTNNDLDIISKTDLINKLEELERFQKLGNLLWQLPKKGHEVFTRPKVNKKKLVEATLRPIELESLIGVMLEHIQRQERKFKVVRRDRLSIKEKLLTLKKELVEGQRVEFQNLLNKKEPSTEDLVITFISILELARLRKVQVFQAEVNHNIYVDVVQSLKSFDVDHANGFDEESAGPQLNNEKEEKESSAQEVVLH